MNKKLAMIKDARCTNTRKKADTDTHTFRWPIPPDTETKTGR